MSSHWALILAILLRRFHHLRLAAQIILCLCSPVAMHEGSSSDNYALLDSNNHGVGKLGFEGRSTEDSARPAAAGLWETGAGFVKSLETLEMNLKDTVAENTATSEELSQVATASINQQGNTPHSEQGQSDIEKVSITAYYPNPVLLPASDPSRTLS